MYIDTLDSLLVPSRLPGLDIDLPIPGTDRYWAACSRGHHLVKSLKSALDNFDSADRACDLAYCDTAFEKFNGSFEDFESDRRRSRDEARSVFYTAQTCAAADPFAARILRFHAAGERDLRHG